jgi:hypothetical protein
MKQKFKTAKKVSATCCWVSSCYLSRIVRETPLALPVSVFSSLNNNTHVLILFIGVRSFWWDLTLTYKPKTNHWWKVTVIIPEYFKQYERVQCLLKLFTSHSHVLTMDASWIWSGVWSNDLHSWRTSSARYNAALFLEAISYPHFRYYRWFWGRPSCRVHHPARSKGGRLPWVCYWIQL